MIDERYVNAAIKQLLKKIPLARDYQEIMDEVEKGIFDEKMKNQLNAILAFTIDSNMKSNQLYNLIDDKKTQLHIDNNESPTDNFHNQINQLNELRKIIQQKFGSQFSDIIMHKQLTYDQSELFTESLDQESFLELLHYFPTTFIIPVLAANVADILIEGQAHYEMASGIEYEILKSLSIAEAELIKKDDKTKLQGYELLSMMGLIVENTDYFEKYLKLYKSVESGYYSKGLQNSTWWGQQYYYNRLNVMKDEFFNAFQNSSYKLAKLHMAFIIAAFEFNDVQKVLELFDITDESPLYKELVKIKFIN